MYIGKHKFAKTNFPVNNFDDILQKCNTGFCATNVQILQLTCQLKQKDLKTMLIQFDLGKKWKKKGNIEKKGKNTKMKKRKRQ